MAASSRGTLGKTVKKTVPLSVPPTSQLVRELRRLTQMTQVQLATELGVAYETINRWENGHRQPSALALRQIRAVLEQLTQSGSPALQMGSQCLLDRYFSDGRSHPGTDVLIQPSDRSIQPPVF